MQNRREGIDLPDVVAGQVPASGCASGFEPGGAATPETLAPLLRADFERNARLVKAFDIRPE